MLFWCRISGIQTGVSHAFCAREPARNLLRIQGATQFFFCVDLCVWDGMMTWRWVKTIQVPLLILILLIRNQPIPLITTNPMTGLGSEHLIGSGMMQPKYGNKLSSKLGCESAGRSRLAEAELGNNALLRGSCRGSSSHNLS